MAIVVPKNFGAGGVGIHRGHGDPDIKEIVFALVNELNVLRTAVTGLTAKLDADTGVNDTDYASTLDPAAITISNET